MFTARYGLSPYVTRLGFVLKGLIFCLTDDSRSANPKHREAEGSSKQETVYYLCLLRDFTARWQQELSLCSELSIVIIV